MFKRLLHRLWFMPKLQEKRNIALHQGDEYHLYFWLAGVRGVVRILVMGAFLLPGVLLVMTFGVKLSLKVLGLFVAMVIGIFLSVAIGSWEEVE